MPSVSSSNSPAEKRDNCSGVDSSVASSSARDMSDKEIIVITPPPNAMDSETNSPFPEIVEDSCLDWQEKTDAKPILKRKIKVSRDDSTIDDSAHSLLGLHVHERTLTSSKSCHDIANHEEDSGGISFNLAIPDSLKGHRALSAEFGSKDTSHVKQGKVAEKVKKTKSMPRSGIPSLSTKHFFDASPREGRKGANVSRTRSQSPVLPFFMRSFSGKTSPENPKLAPWSHPLRFLSRKPPGTPASTSNALTEFTWMGNDTDTVSDLGENQDSILNSAANSGSWYSDNGMEMPVVPTSATPMSSAGGPSTSSIASDVPDGLQSGGRSSAIEHLKQKIRKISEQIKIERATMDENVAEYLKLANNADKQQAARIKSVFEKKNQKSKANVAQLQKKYENYQKKLKEYENGGPSKNPPKYGLKDVHAKLSDISGGVVDSVKGSLSGLSQSVVNKPKEMASKFKNKFGSADNISTLKDDEEGSEDIGRSSSADNLSLTNSGSTEFPEAENKVVYLQIQEMLTLKSEISNMHREMTKIEELTTQQERLKSDIDLIKSQTQRDINLLRDSLQDERFRCARLEDQLHDLSELHHRELSDIKQEIASMEEKIEYHAQERARDIQEALESCQTRIAKMEVQQHHQHQQLVTMEGVENATARALLGKLINLLLSILAVILVFVSTVSGIVMPFFRSQTRMAFSAILVILLALLYRNWDTVASTTSSFWADR